MYVLYFLVRKNSSVTISLSWIGINKLKAFYIVHPNSYHLFKQWYHDLRSAISSKMRFTFKVQPDTFYYAVLTCHVNSYFPLSPNLHPAYVNTRWTRMDSTREDMQECFSDRAISARFSAYYITNRSTHKIQYIWRAISTCATKPLMIR